MSDGKDISNLTRLPFANYDIIVYFGGGLFSLPFIARYSFLSKNQFPEIFTAFKDPFINTAITVLALLFSLYVIGHGIAYLSSIVVERFLFRTIDFPSRLMLSMRGVALYQRNRALRILIGQRIWKNFFKEPYFSDWMRFILHIPVIPVYLVMFVLGLFGFYQAKLPEIILNRISEKLLKDYNIDLNHQSGNGWFKLVEHYCISNIPNCLPRMYNYLIMYGIMRSISLIVLISIWCELVIYVTIGGLGFMNPDDHGSVTVRLFMLYGAYFISFSAFGKFNRRYGEEAVLSFALFEK